MAIFEAQGYHLLRSAGSRGAWDFIAIRRDGIVLVQVRHGDWPGPKERATLAAMPSPKDARKELHRWRSRAREPDVMVWDHEECTWRIVDTEKVKAA